MKRTVLTTLLVSCLAICVMLVATPRGRAGDKDNDESRVKRGYEIAPVPLNLKGKNRELVGLGSYIVNGVGDCNGCHAGPAGEFSPGGDPFQGEPKHINPDSYLSGGTPIFGPIFLPRNLTPDKTGLPEGGASFEEFRGIMRTGIDPDQAHLFIGNPYLQVMPWPNFQNMTDRQLTAIYTFISSVPCLEGGPGEPAHRCK